MSSFSGPFASSHTIRWEFIYDDSAHLHGPLGMVMAANGNLIVANGDAVNPDPAYFSELVEFTPHGRFVSEFQVGTAAGSAFGIATQTEDGYVRFAAVDDNTNTVSIWTLRSRIHNH